MTYTPEVGHVITFANTYDNKSIYQVVAVGPYRVEVTPVNLPDDGYPVTFNLSFDIFSEMGGTPVVLSDEEMNAMETIYAGMVLDGFDKMEMAMTFTAIFGDEIGKILFPVEELETMVTNIQNFGKGIKFLKTARANAASV